MTDQPNAHSAITGDAKTASSSNKAVLAGDGLLKAPHSEDGLSEQYKASQKILAEVNSNGLRSRVIANLQPVLALADAPVSDAKAVAAPGKAEPSAIAIAIATVTAPALEHHDASFFKSDYLHDTERVANVWGNSFSKYLKQGVTDAAKENLKTGDWVGKFETGMMIGATLRTILPKQGVIRAVASTVMAVNMAKDLAIPFYRGAQDAIDSKDDRELDLASRKVSAGVGNFVVDNLIGLPAAGLGEAGTGAVLERAVPDFEMRKTEFWTSNKSSMGAALNSVADKVDGATSKFSEKINAPDPLTVERAAARKAISELSPDAKANILQKAGEHARKHIESAEFYKLGPAIAVEAKAAEPGPLADLSMDERPISLGAIRRIKADEVPPKFSTDESGDPTAGHHLEVEGKRLGFTRYLNALEDGQRAETAIFPKTDDSAHGSGTTLNAADKSRSSIGLDSSQRGIAGPSTPDEVKTRRRPGPDIAVSPDHLDNADGSNFARNGGRKTKTGDVPDDGTKKTGDTKAGDVRPGDSSKATESVDKTSGTDSVKKPVSVSSPKDDLKPSVFAKVAEVAKAVQELWTPEKIKLADARDQFKGPINATTEMDRAVLPPEYKPSTIQLLDLINQIDSVKNLKAAGMLLMYHMKASNQLLFEQDNVRDLNMLTHELAGVFLKGMRKLGIPEDRLRRIIPSLVTETDDKGSGYFTLPPIDGVIDRPVTVVPRAFTRLISVMSDVIRHETLGHDHTYPELARFPEADRDNLIRGAIAKTMKEEKIPDKTIKMGTENITTSEFMYRLLKAEANENTSDFMGTLSGGIGTPASLGVLLQSLRDGGLLETRNVYGKEFEDGIEPHGIDRWRIKFCAEVMRQLAPSDKTTNDYADALDQYAKEASRAGDTYTWASTDKPGEKVDLPMAHWDAIIPRIVKAQLDTPLDTLKDVAGSKHTLREMLGDNFAENVKGIDDLANQFVDAIHDGKTELPSFDKTKYTIGQVFSAGLVAWMRATRHDLDPVESLKSIDKISSNLRSQYRDYNPNEVPLTTPGSVKLKQALSQSPAQILRMTGAAVVDGAPSIRYGADKVAGIMGGTATGDVYASSQWLYKEAHDMAQRTREVTGVTPVPSATEKTP